MFTRVQDSEFYHRLFIEMIINNTADVTKVSPNSVLSGMAWGMGKAGQKAAKDVALVETHLFPDFASGQYLDNIAQFYGIPPRFGAAGSSTFIRLVGTAGTVYQQGVHTFTGNHGITFELTKNVAIPSSGYTYARVRSTDLGSATNVDPLSITIINSAPSGHRYVVNEYQAIGGRDNESDDNFKARIKNSWNINNRGTLAYLVQVCHSINENVLDIRYHGSNDQGQSILKVITQNGVLLSSSELQTLTQSISSYLSLSELASPGNANIGIVMENIEYQAIDISFRVVLEADANADDVRINTQTAMSKYLDPVTWLPGQTVEWDDLLTIAKSQKGVKYISDTYFTPNIDVPVDINKLPRIRGFLMLDGDGAIISDIQGNLVPVYYPLNPDFSFQQTLTTN